MGGIVARLTPIRHPATALLLPNIVTLATPHANPLYAFDQSVQDVYQQIIRHSSQEVETNTNSTLIVSVSSGLRDEMIEPSTSYLGDRPWAVSVSTTQGNVGYVSLEPRFEKSSQHHQTLFLLMHQILSPGLLPRGAFGMDHRAIAWCHGVLDQVRKVIWTLALSSDEDVATRRKKVEATLGPHSFLEDRAKMNANYDVSSRMYAIAQFTGAVSHGDNTCLLCFASSKYMDSGEV
jgi:hypothetical protein